MNHEAPHQKLTKYCMMTNIIKKKNLYVLLKNITPKCDQCLHTDQKVTRIFWSTVWIVKGEKLMGTMKYFQSTNSLRILPIY